MKQRHVRQTLRNIQRYINGLTGITNPLRHERPLIPDHRLQSLEGRLLLSSEYLTALYAGGVDSAVVVGSDTLTAPVAPDATMYGQRVMVDPNASAEVSAVAQRLVGELQRMSGRDFVIETNTAGMGIYLVHVDDVSRFAVPVALDSRLTTLATKGDEGFIAYSDGSDSLWIIGNSDLAISHGAFYYLEQLGWRSLLPSDAWTIRPHLDQVAISIDVVEEPAWRNRSFFGTGGFGGILPVDPNQQVEGAWAAWQQANRMGGEIQIAGHAGTSFNNLHKAWLEADPSRRPLVNGSVVDWDEHMKLRYGNTDVQQRYIDERTAAFQDLLNTHGADTPQTYAISVEPTDGPKHDESPESLALGGRPGGSTISDRVFHVANLVAQEMANDFSGVANDYNVSLFAYNQHADIPYFTLESNMYVGVAAYAFQRTGMTPEELLTAWSNFHNNIGVYDYWSLPDWTYSMPDISYQEAADRIALWDSLGYDSAQLESINSAGAVGMIMYQMSRQTWDPTADLAAVRQEFYDLSFGAAAPAMQRMLERWYTDFQLSEQELGLSYQDIIEARSLAANDAESLARVNDYAKYIHYMRLYLEYDHVRRDEAIGGTNRHAAADAFLEFNWRIHDTAMVSSFRIGELVRNRLELKVDSNGNVLEEDVALRADWDTSNSNANGWALVTPLTDAELTTLINDGATQYPVLIEQPVFSETLTPHASSFTLDGVMVETPRLAGNTTFEFHVPSGLTSVDFEIEVFSVNGTDDRVRVFDPNGTEVYDNTFSKNGGGWQSFTVNTAVAGNYTMEVMDQKSFFALNVEQKLPFVLKGPLISINQSNVPPVYVYVPEGTPKVAVNADTSNAGMIVRDSSGQTLTPSFGTGVELSLYDVPVGEDDAVWSIDEVRDSNGLTLLNIPQVWAFSPDGMMVPVNQAPTVDAGVDQTIVSPTNQVTLKGSAVDDHMPHNTAGSMTSAWTQISGPGNVTFTDATSPNTTATFPTAGTYVLRLTATDKASASTYDEITINVLSQAANTAPVVDAGSDATLSINNGTLSLVGSVTDDGQGGAPLTSTWSEVDGPGHVTFADSTSASTTVSFSRPGEYTLRLTGKDGELVSHDELKVTVLPDYNASHYAVGDRGVFGNGEDFDYNANGQTFNSTDDEYSVRFRALEDVTVDRVFQRYVAVDPNTTIEVGIMADDGTGRPTGTFLASTGTIDPADGDHQTWTTLTQSVNLQNGQVYHLVTRATSLGAGESFIVRRSTSAQSIRPYDRAFDEAMTALTLDDGADWIESGFDPYFVLGNGVDGSGSAVVVNGPGNGIALAHQTLLETRGGTGAAYGQRFRITNAEVPDGSVVRTDHLRLTMTTTGSPTDDLIVHLRNASGTVLGQFSVNPSEADGTERTWYFDNGAYVDLVPNEEYLITTAFGGSGGTTSQTYRIVTKMTHADAVAGFSNADSSYGGVTYAMPIESGASNNWSTWTDYTVRDNADVRFSFDGDVIAQPAVAPAYSFGDTGVFGNSGDYGYGNGTGYIINSTSDAFAARFRALETITIDRVMQRIPGLDVGTQIEVKIVADDGQGNPGSTVLTTTGAYDPDESTQFIWSAFQQAVTLHAGESYWVITSATTLGAGESFVVYRSNWQEGARPFDRSVDALMEAYHQTDGHEWVATANDPYFTFGYGTDGSGNTQIVPGPGNAHAITTTGYLSTTGGGGAAVGQRFQISEREMPIGGRLQTTGLTLRVVSSGSPTDPLLVMLRDEQGNVLGQFSVTPAQADGQERTYSFDNQVVVELNPNETYLITTEFGGSGGTGAQQYRLDATSTVAATDEASYGGTTYAMPVTSSNGWTSWSDYTARSYADMWFRIDGQIVGQQAHYDVNDNGVFGNGEYFNYSSPGQTFNSLDDQYSARFTADQTTTIDRVMQRLIGIDAGTTIEIGIMADDGQGNPTGTFLASTGVIDPTDGNSLDWAVLTSSLELQAQQVYHVVTRAIALGSGESFMIYRSSSQTDIRPYDRAEDTMMNAMTSTNGGAWSASTYDPYFLFGNGVDGQGNVNIIPSLGNGGAFITAGYLTTRGGTGSTSTASGQQFQISTAEVPLGTLVRTTGLTMQFNQVGSPTDPLIVKLRDEYGAVLGQFTVQPSEADGTSRTWNFDNSVAVDLSPDTTYLITTEFGGGGGTSSQLYQLYATSTVATHAEASWGGSTTNTPIISAAGNDWSSPAINTSRPYADVFFSFTGDVLAATARDGFESGVGNWSLAGTAAVTSLYSPRSGQSHLRLTGSTSSATRAVDLSSLVNGRLQLFYNGNNWQAGDTATIDIYVGGAWQTIRTLTTADATGSYQFADLDLSGFSLDSSFQLRISTQLTGSAELFVDDLHIA